ncbi:MULTISPECIES: hypothetical protein [Pontibacillus]|uniref:Uncharacterized protein n=1 Tax=Pontibacillus chungwhensis TaxID=265426 RepID=A0ABY8V0L2_9BACI|nr:MULTISPECIES: hypothetical protein [Pontibacillus]MCD5324380.1 hypothetical protein [Pontibacillus sp. HN14]WIF99322.1 hypothetical protein QNI29_06605 [Pontibacillus chungwhensis]
MNFNNIKSKLDNLGAIQSITISYLETTEDDDSVFDVYVNIKHNTNAKQEFESLIVKEEIPLEEAESIAQRLTNSLGRYYKNVQYQGHELQ